METIKEIIMMMTQKTSKWEENIIVAKMINFSEQIIKMAKQVKIKMIMKIMKIFKCYKEMLKLIIKILKDLIMQIRVKKKDRMKVMMQRTLKY